MSGTGASNLGYGGEYPSSDVNPAVVNITNSHNPANFSSNVVPSSCAGFRGGGGSFKRKIKNLIKRYRMKGSKRRTMSMKRRIRSKYLSKRRRGGKSRRASRKRRSRAQKGGYAQYTPAGNSGYSVGGDLSSNNLGLANPPPITPNTGANSNCFTAYKH